MADVNWLLKRARELRREQTPTEAILWRTLRGRRFAGFKFRRQVVMRGYILDFYCATIKLVIELDGDSHAGNEEVDAIRTAELERIGIKVLRFWNPEIYDNLDGIPESIYEECLRRDAAVKKKTPSPQPSPRKAGAREKKRRPEF